MIVRLLVGCLLVVSCDKSSPTPGASPTGESGASKTSIRAETAVYKPVFVTTAGELEAGTAFVARLSAGSPLLLVTAHHLFGTDGGLDREYTWDELPKFVSKVTAKSIDTSPPVTASAAIGIEGATKYSQAAIGGDVAAFVVTAPTDAPALSFVAARPREGTPVWLIAPVEGSRELRHRAVVVQMDDDMIGYAFDNAKIELRATSGAPVVTATGEVVAINIASGTQDGKTIGFGNPAWSVSKRLLAATSKR